MDRYYVGDYIRWVKNVLTYSASSHGVVTPIEKEYDYGIVLYIAEAGELSTSDIIIVRSVLNQSWLMTATNDEEYEIVLMSPSPERPAKARG